MCNKYTIMDKTINKSNKYLDFKGLEAYDKLIKSYIAYSNKTLKESIDAELKSKQNTIEDLETIRSGAALGATSLQPAQIVKNNDIDNIFKNI